MPGRCKSCDIFLIRRPLSSPTHQLMTMALTHQCADQRLFPTLLLPWVYPMSRQPRSTYPPPLLIFMTIGSHFWAGLAPHQNTACPLTKTREAKSEVRFEQSCRPAPTEKYY